jgi:rubrerythrin
MLKFLHRHKEDPEFLARRMKGKLSVYRCRNCERRAQKDGHTEPYLFYRVSRGNKCPVCGSNSIQKISIGAVIEHRWNKTVKEQLISIHSPA